MKDYHVHPTLALFHDSDDFYRGVKGPVGSGKSTGMCQELFRRAQEQEPNPEGTRKSRWAIIRNTYRELEDTTLNTWLFCFPEADFGEFKRSNMAHHIKLGMEDGTILDAEFLFRALDRPKDVAKLLSLELTGGWINEARELPKGVVDALGDRVGRYPAVIEGGATWSGVIMDTNAPDDDHWWYRLAEEETPIGWNFWNQPGGLIETKQGDFAANPKAENTKYLPKDYYTTRMAGKSPAYIKVYYCNDYGFVQEGKPIYPEYRDHVHAASHAIEPLEGRTIYIGIDFGLTPAATFGQRNVMGAWRWLDELVTEDMGAVRFAEILGQKIRDEYPGYDFEIYGDPAGDDRAQTDERTPFDILKARGIPVDAAPSNDPIVRREAVAIPLMRMIDGDPGLVISPKCRELRKGMAGGYHYKRIQVAGDERFHDKPNKNRYSHVCDAAQYMMLGAGEGDAVVRSKRKKRKELQYGNGAEIV